LLLDDEVSRTDFILEAACRRAASVLADRIHFEVPGEEFRRFTDMLDARPVSNVRLTALPSASTPWAPRDN
jgi:uncharacterized protein (DUF1778 family)